MMRPNVLDAIRNLLRFERGQSTFVVGTDGEWSHTATVVTVKMCPGESHEEFHVRLRRDYGLQYGDTIELLNNGGKADTARLTLKPR